MIRAWKRFYGQSLSHFHRTIFNFGFIPPFLMFVQLTLIGFDLNRLNDDNARWTMNKFLKSVLKTAVYFLEQSDRLAADVRDRVADTVDRASDRAADLRDRAQVLYEGEDHTVRNLLTFAAGVAVGVGAGMLLAPASGEELRGSIEEKVHDISDRVKSRFSSDVRNSTGTEGD
jgi:uncharacterized protein YjbJ (UPF0337 family)